MFFERSEDKTKKKHIYVQLHELISRFMHFKYPDIFMYRNTTKLVVEVINNSPKKTEQYQIFIQINLFLGILKVMSCLHVFLFLSFQRFCYT